MNVAPSVRVVLKDWPVDLSTMALAALQVTVAAAQIE
jgi:hypothetical protein